MERFNYCIEAETATENSTIKTFFSFTSFVDVLVFYT